MISRIRPIVGRAPGSSRAYLGLTQFGNRASKYAFHTDGRARISNFWIPTGGITKKPVEGEREDTNDLLVRGGFLRQAYAGIFHMLPLGLRVQDKLEKLIDKHMQSVGASKVSLSSISAQELWEQSGRLKEGSDVFRFLDRKEARFLLAPTHEEEITTLVGSLTKSYRDLPVRVYQISRKYRDEQRPRQGLLRGREFIMKDMYTFDYSPETALQTYVAVKGAYTRLFDELKIPYLVAAADSGNMGGSLSHEFHFPSAKGEDTVISCTSCDSVYNEELADGKAHSGEEGQMQTQQKPGFDTGETSGEATPAVSVGLWMSISKDKNTLLRCWFPQFTVQETPVEREVNSHAVKSIAEAADMEIDIGVENPLQQWAAHVKSNRSSGQRPRIVDLYDSRVRAFKRPPLTDTLQAAGCTVEDVDFSKLDRFPGTNDYLNVVRVHEGDRCAKCGEGVAQTHKAVELGHTFLLGTRYSDVLKATVMVDQSAITKGKDNAGPQTVPMEMGCHGIGVSRMITAVADSLADGKGLNWPRVIAPYEVIIVPGKGLEADAEKVYDALTAAVALGSPALDVILDDRDKQMGWKLGDADLIGYPVIVVVGKGWKKQETLEVQCRRLGVREDVRLEALPAFVQSLLQRL
ncbi:putative proline--tRNA ligase AIM10 [Aspergillus saccharolyticus JOP 1030-1]|uniref:proline--tRNA ligase n=1 Tax=Aspergillus saccharolyticus JOP 1030-1 TaxID=1450539 RepID=A0A318ZDS7_9EURO|nr:prolyl-tRNA synthetase [Aspergillus saccharolyticus JOP 1030-1]PYH44444.1 prolyl-tRNA synthetase [Aspergillus saccharolyticus JOP 1030-1]